ncbi:hypothetical protein V6N13_101068 [Hibiscus sabdariffa]|uniref:Uncharacterized protein n=1 Tax=Hibiscus sabdariffa TaxID=183260 RepID=A0ABR2QK92_9ROSI
MHDTPFLPPLPTVDQCVGPDGRPPYGLPEAVDSTIGENGMRDGADMDMDDSYVTSRGVARQKVIENLPEGLAMGKESEGPSTGDVSATPKALETLRSSILRPVTVTPQPKLTKNVAYMQSNPAKKSKGASSRAVQSEPMPVTVDEDVIVVTKDSVGKSDNHQAVTLVDKKYDNLEPTGGNVVKARGQASKGPFVEARKGFPIKKHPEVQSRPQLVLLDWMLNFSRQLDAPPSNSGLAVDGKTQVVLIDRWNWPRGGELATKNVGD